MDDKTLTIAVLVPCYNEALTIGKVVDDFRTSLPGADIYVYDNNSTDGTGAIAKEHGAIVRTCPLQGKGNVTRQMFREIKADAYLMVDGDDTYPAESAQTLLAPIIAGEADMAIGDRLQDGKGAYYDAEAAHENRAFHSFGNKVVIRLIDSLYRTDVRDVMTGYRAFSRLFVETYPVTSNGFEVETEMTIHALDHGFRIAQIPIEFRERPAGSQSKINTFTDGVLVLRTIGSLFREYKPMRFFGAIALILLIVTLLLGIPVIIEFATTNYITHVPLAIAAAGCAILTALFFITGLILDSTARQTRKAYELTVIERARAIEEEEEEDTDRN